MLSKYLHKLKYRQYEHKVHAVPQAVGNAVLGRSNSLFFDPNSK